MPTKEIDTRTGRYVVAFRLPPEVGAEQAWLAGDFNQWSTEALPMHREADGGMLCVVEDLEPGAEFRFRYYLGDGRWENDWAADAYVENEFGGSDSLLVLPSESVPPPPVKAAAAPAKKAAAKKAAVAASGTASADAAAAAAAAPAKKKAAPRKAAAKKSAGNGNGA
jgi:hypothetical protein